MDGDLDLSRCHPVSRRPVRHDGESPVVSKTEVLLNTYVEKGDSASVCFRRGLPVFPPVLSSDPDWVGVSYP